MIRLFAALSIPEDIGLALARRQHGIDNARWRPLDALHVTLRFFGEVREDVARDLDAELVQIRSGPFEIAFQGAGAFGEAAAWPVQGFLHHFWDEFEYFVRNGRSIVDDQLAAANQGVAA